MAYNLATADISFSTSGDQTVIAGVTGRRLRIWAITIENTDATTDTTIVFKDGTTALNGTGVLLTGGGGSYELGTLQGVNYVYESAAQGNAFVINSSAAVAVTGRVWYQAI